MNKLTLTARVDKFMETPKIIAVLITNPDIGELLAIYPCNCIIATETSMKVFTIEEIRAKTSRYSVQRILDNVMANA